MKNSKLLSLFVVILFLLHFHNDVYSQIQIIENGKKTEVGKLKAGYITIAELTYSIEEKDTVYSMIYRNAKYSQIDSYETLTFSGEGNTLNTLFDLMQKAILSENPKEYEVTIKLGIEPLIIKGYKSMGVKGVQFLTSKGWLAPINETQLKKLFGK